jgi:acyl carrier protein
MLLRTGTLGCHRPPRTARGAKLMELPTIEDLASQLQAVSGAETVDVDVALLHISDIDSLDLMEWLYGFQKRYPHIPADESLFSAIDNSTTLRTVHEKIISLVPHQTQLT